MNILSDIYTIWLRELIRFVRAPSRIVTSVTLPFFFLIFIGLGFSSWLKDSLDLDYSNFIAPGIIGMIILFSSISGGMSLMWDKQFGFLKEIMVAPISRISIMLGKTLGGATVGLINGIIMLFISIMMGMIDLKVDIIISLLFMILIAISFISITLILALKIKSFEGFQMINSFFLMPIFFLSGAIYPMEHTPSWMQTASYLDPLTYGIDGLRNSLIGVGVFPIWVNLMVLGIFSGSLILFGGYIFSRSNI